MDALVSDMRDSCVSTLGGPVWSLSVIVGQSPACCNTVDRARCASVVVGLQADCRSWSVSGVLDCGVMSHRGSICVPTSPSPPVTAGS